MSLAISSRRKAPAVQAQRAERDQFAAAVAYQKKRGGKAPLNVSAERRRPCVRLDESGDNPAYGDLHKS